MQVLCSLRARIAKVSPMIVSSSGTAILRGRLALDLPAVIAYSVKSARSMDLLSYFEQQIPSPSGQSGDASARARPAEQPG